MKVTLNPENVKFSDLPLEDIDANPPSVMQQMMEQIIRRTLEEGICVVTCLGRVQAVYINTTAGITTLDRSLWAMHGINEVGDQS